MDKIFDRGQFRSYRIGKKGRKERLEEKNVTFPEIAIVKQKREKKRKKEKENFPCGEIGLDVTEKKIIP